MDLVQLPISSSSDFLPCLPPECIDDYFNDINTEIDALVSECDGVEKQGSTQNNDMRVQINNLLLCQPQYEMISPPPFNNCMQQQNTDNPIGERNPPPTKKFNSIGTRTRRSRTIYKSSQLVELEKEFANDIYPPRVKRIQIAESLSLPEQQIKIWFQNRRMKLKKEQNNKSSPTISNKSCSPPNPSLNSPNQFSPSTQHIHSNQIRSCSRNHTAVQSLHKAPYQAYPQCTHQWGNHGLYPSQYHQHQMDMRVQLQYPNTYTEHTPVKYILNENNELVLENNKVISNQPNPHTADKKGSTGNFLENNVLTGSTSTLNVLVNTNEQYLGDITSPESISSSL